MYLLKQFKNCIKYNGKIYFSKNKKYNTTYCNITISSKRIIEDLYDNFNITSKKSLTLKPPEIERDDLILSFIVGLIDGDGSVGSYFYKKQNKEYFIITLCGTREITNWVLSQINKIIPFEKKRKKIPIGTKKGKNTWLINISGQQALSFIERVNSSTIPYSKKWIK